MTTRIQFCGAAGTVTGSSSRVEHDAGQFMVDCGLFQGNKTTQQLNYRPFSFDASAIDHLLLTHAHIDHSGLLPKLTAAGFGGQMHCTDATARLLEFMLGDSAHIQEQNAERQNRKRARRGEPLIEPIYTQRDTVQTLSCLRPHDYEQWFTPGDGVRARFWNAGHLLGSASIEVEVMHEGKPIRLLFSGDLGPEQKAFHPEPDAPSGYDYIICESTYGDRDRDDYTLDARREAMRDELKRGLSRGGNVIIPSFAVERSQELLHDIGALLDAGEIPEADVYLDSPLARKATEVFMDFATDFEDIEVDSSRLFRHPNFHIVQSVEESKAVNRIRRGAIIISASGMCNAGRIKHHLRANIYRPESTILFVGYQSPGTLGHIITHGAHSVRIHGKEYQVRAEIRRLGNYSAHADQEELLEWLSERTPIRGGVFLNHGEDDSRAELAKLITKRGIEGEKVYQPQLGETFELMSDGKPSSMGVPEAPVPHDQLYDDWHNEYAKLMLELGEKLRSTDDPGLRKRMLLRLREAIEG